MKPTLVAETAKIRDYIAQNRTAMLAKLKQIVELESHTEDRAGVNRVGELLSAELRDLGFTVRTLPEQAYGDHVVGELEQPGKPRVLLMGHMDTVYPTGTGWGFSITGDRAHGPGVIDMKSGDLTLIYALKALKATTGIPVALRVFYNSEEEPGSPRSRHLIADIAKGIDYAFVLEPSDADGAIVTQRKGVGIFTLTVKGRSAHAGQEPEKGINANRELAFQIIAAEDLANPSVGTTVNAGRIEGGVVPYAISEHAQARIDVRVTSLDEQARMEQGMAALQKANRVSGTEITVTGGFHRPPMVEIARTGQLIAAINEAAAACGQSVRFGSSGGASDGNNLVALGIPVIDGIGAIGGRAHSREEYMEVESFFARTELLAAALLVLGGS